MTRNSHLSQSKQLMSLTQGSRSENFDGGKEIKTPDLMIVLIW
jgi:hypothetical protein